MIQLTKRSIETALSLKNKMLHWNLLYDLLTREFTRLNLNNDIHEISYKVELVDKLFNCNLMPDDRKVANAILNLNLDSEFENSDSITTVNKIAEIKLPKYNKKENCKRLGKVFAIPLMIIHSKPVFFTVLNTSSDTAISSGKNPRGLKSLPKKC